MTDATQHVVAPAAEAQPGPQPIDMAKYIGAYIRLRAKKKELQAKHKAELEPIQKTMDQIEALCGNQLKALNATSLPTKGGTCYESITASASINDPIEFQGYVIANRAWDMIDWKCNTTAAQDYLKEHKEFPPGVTVTPFRKVNFRAPTSKDDE